MLSIFVYYLSLLSISFFHLQPLFSNYRFKHDNYTNWYYLFSCNLLFHALKRQICRMPPLTFMYIPTKNTVRMEFNYISHIAIYLLNNFYLHFCEKFLLLHENEKQLKRLNKILVHASFGFSEFNFFGSCVLFSRQSWTFWK